VDFKNYKLLWSLLSLLLILNVLALYGRVNLQQQVEQLQYRVLLTENPIIAPLGNIRFAHAAASKEFKVKPISLIAFLTDYGCTSCLSAEIRYLNEWNQKYTNSVKAYFVGESINYLEKYGANFEYKTQINPEELVNVYLPISNPVILVVDERGTVHSIHTNDTPRPGSDRRRDEFYYRTASLFDTFYTKQVIFSSKDICKL